MCCCAFTSSKYADAHICVQNKYCVEPHELHCYCRLCWPASQYGFYTRQSAALVLKTNVPTLPLKMASLGRNTWNSPNLVTWRFHCRPRCSRGFISVKKALARTCGSDLQQETLLYKTGVRKRGSHWNWPEKTEVRMRKLAIKGSVNKPVALWGRERSRRVDRRLSRSWGTTQIAEIQIRMRRYSETKYQEYHTDNNRVHACTCFSIR